MPERVVGGQLRRRGDAVPGLLRQRQLGGVEVLREVLEPARGDHGAVDARAAQDPGDHHLGDRPAELPGDLGEELDQVVGAVPVHHVGLRPAGALTGVGRGLGAAADPAVEQPLAQRAPAEGRDPEVPGGRDDLVLDLPGLRRVVRLVRDRALQPRRPGLVDRLGQLPPVVVGHAPVPDLPGPDQLVGGGDGLGDRGLPVPLVDVEQVEVVGPQPLQAVLDRAGEVEAAGAAVVGAVPGGGPRLGGEDDVVPPAPQDLAQDALRVPGGVQVGGVDEVHAAVQGLVDLAAGLVRAEARDLLEPSAGAEGDGAQGQPGDVEAGTAESGVLHGELLWS